MAENQVKKPAVKYRVELEKRLEINKSYKERRNRAIALRILSYGLFGQKRFQNLYLSCSLNCFYWTLQIATILHQRVAGLAMIIKFEQVHVIQYYQNSEEAGKGYAEKKYNKILVKLTKNPSEEDKKEPGYNPGFKSEDIKDQMKDVLGRKQGQARKDNRSSPRRNQRNNNYNRRPYDREGGQGGGRGGERRERRDYRQDRGERREKQDKGGERKDRQEKGERPERRDRRERDERVDRRGQYEDRRNRGGNEGRNEGRYERKDRNQTRESYQPRDRTQTRQQRPRKDYGERRYNDDRDQRREYEKAPENPPRYQQRGERKVRGGSSGYNDRAGTTEHREPRYQPKKEERIPPKADREQRGDRKPRRAAKYSDSD